MSNADNMFYSLGYEKTYEVEINRCWGLKSEYTSENTVILFYANQTISKIYKRGEIHDPNISISELKAINKKCEELRLDRRKYKYRKRTY